MHHWLLDLHVLSVGKLFSVPQSNLHLVETDLVQLMKCAGQPYEDCLLNAKVSDFNFEYTDFDPCKHCKTIQKQKRELPRLYTRATSNCSVDLIAHVQTPLAFEPFLNFVIRKEKRRITAHDSQ